MWLGTIREARSIAKKFERQVRLVETRHSDEIKRLTSPESTRTINEGIISIGYTKESAALRRLSMDLTRILADMRAGR